MNKIELNQLNISKIHKNNKDYKEIELLIKDYFIEIDKIIIDKLEDIIFTNGIPNKINEKLNNILLINKK